jgi:hypothetical protein
MAIVNVEGLEREYNALIENCWELKKKFYLENKKEDFVGNKFIDLIEFDRIKEEELNKEKIENK